MMWPLLYNEITDRFGVGTISGDIEAACELSIQVLRNLKRVAKHEDMTEEPAEVLSATNVTVEYRIVTGIGID